MDAALQAAIRRVQTGEDGYQAREALRAELRRARRCVMSAGTSTGFCMEAMDASQGPDETWCQRCTADDARAEDRREEDSDRAFERYLENRYDTGHTFYPGD